MFLPRPFVLDRYRNRDFRAARVGDLQPNVAKL
jgi:hypothetical protein